MSTRVVPRVPVDGPTVDILADSVAGDARTVSLIVRAAPRTEWIAMTTPGTNVIRSSVDGRPIDTSRYRGGVRPWQLDFTAPPDSGVRLVLTVASGAPLSIDLAARLRPLPPLPAVTIPARAPDVVTVQTGDVTIVRRKVVLPGF